MKLDNFLKKSLEAFKYIMLTLDLFESEEFQYLLIKYWSLESPSSPRSFVLIEEFK